MVGSHEGGPAGPLQGGRCRISTGASWQQLVVKLLLVAVLVAVLVAIRRVDGAGAQAGERWLLLEMLRELLLRLRAGLARLC